jgi:hypothetical protein
MTSLIGFARNKAASMGVDVSAFESASIYSTLKRNRVPSSFFSISDTSKTVSFMERAPSDMASICAPFTSGTSSQNMLPISAEPSLNTLNTKLRISVPNIPRKYLISEKKLFRSH